jgi:hypothetical protein
MKKTFILRGVSVFVLVFTLILAGCSDGYKGVDVQDVLVINKFSDPVVTTKLITGGVLLSWAPITEAQGYEVWRSGGGQAAAINLGCDVNKDGIYECWDIVSLTNKLAANTQYTYTVYAVPLSGASDIGKWEGKVTTGAFPEQGSEPAVPTVDFALDYSAKIFTITVTPPTSGIIPNAYWISLSKGVSSVGKWIRQDPSAPVVWTQIADEYGDYEAQNAYEILNSPSGEYTVYVAAQINNPYYKEATLNIYKTVDPLFDGYFFANYYDSFDYTPATVTAKSAVTGLYVQLYLNSFTAKPGVTYTVERATVDKNGKPGAYNAITVYTRTYNNTTDNYDYAQTSLTPDVLGHIPESVYDKGLPIKKETYKYRIKAVKDGISDYLEDIVTTDPSDIGGLELAVSRIANTDDGGNLTSYTFSFTPDLDYTGILQSGDKVVLYSKTSNSSNDYFTPTYTESTYSFSIAELEAKTPVAKSTWTINSTTTSYRYVQAFLVKADGTMKSIRLYYYYYGDGIYTTSTTIDGKTRYACRLSATNY